MTAKPIPQQHYDAVRAYVEAAVAMREALQKLTAANELAVALQQEAQVVWRDRCKDIPEGIYIFPDLGRAVRVTAEVDYPSVDVLVVPEPSTD